MEGRGEERRGEVKEEEGRRKTKSGYAYVSARRQTDTHTQTHRSENSISASFTPFTWRI